MIRKNLRKQFEKYSVRRLFFYVVLFSFFYIFVSYNIIKSVSCDFLIGYEVFFVVFVALFIPFTLFVLYEFSVIFESKPKKKSKKNIYLVLWIMIQVCLFFILFFGTIDFGTGCLTFTSINIGDARLSLSMENVKFYVDEDDLYHIESEYAFLNGVFESGLVDKNSIELVSKNNLGEGCKLIRIDDVLFEESNKEVLIWNAEDFSVELLCSRDALMADIWKKDSFEGEVVLRLKDTSTNYLIEVREDVNLLVKKFERISE